MKRARTAFLVAVVCLALTTGGDPVSAAKKKTKPFKATGHVLAVNAPLTWYEFALFSCPAMPESQGVTGYVVELPPKYRSGGWGTVTTTSPTDTGLSMVFFDSTCASLGTAIESDAVPAGTQWIEVHSYSSVDYDFELTVEPTS